MMKLSNYIIGFLVFIFCASGTRAIPADNSYLFTRISTDHGLSHNQVQSIFKDSQGYMWFGTNFGLNRFDGYSFKIYRHIPSDSTSLSDNRIRGIFEGPNGKLWLSLMETFTIFDPITEEFSSDDAVFHKNIEVPAEQIDQIFCDNAGNIWMVADEKAAYVYLTDSDSTMRIALGSNQPDEVMNTAISSVIVDTLGKFWVIGFYGVLERFDPHQQKVTYRNDYLNKVHPERRTLALFYDRNNNIWLHSLSSDEGVVQFKISEEEFKHYHQESEQLQISNNIINSITQDSEGIIWLATDHGGINLLDPVKGEVTILKHNPEDDRSLSQNSITTLYRDDQDIIWAGTFKKGICYYHKNLYKFPLYRHQESDPKSIPYDDINAFQEDVKGNLWLGTNGNGLVYFNRKTNQYTLYQHDENNPQSLSNDVIVSMLYDNQQQLWLGTYYGGLNLFDGKKFKHYRNNPEDGTSLSNDRVWELFQDNSGNIWVGTLGSGLDLYLPETETFSHFTQEQGLASDFILSIAEDSNNNLWIGTANGLFKYIPLQERFIPYLYDADDTSSISHNVVSSLCVDSRGLIWAATQEGLSIYNKAEEVFYRYYVEDGLPDNTILAVIEDDMGTIWASTINGITNIKISENKNGRPELTFRNYSEADGLQGKDFNEDVAFKTSKGELIFAGPDGFNLFNPGELQFNKKTPKVVFTDFQVFNKSIGIGDKLDGRVLLKAPINKMDRVVLKHYEDIISIEFSALNYIHPEKNRFKYMLEGFNRDWIEVSPEERKVTYTNLDPGDYTFKVRASNNDGVWNEEGITMHILIRPPIWRSKGAIVFYFFFLLGSLILLRYLILLRERTRFVHAQEKLEAQRLHELDLLKIRFFTNVSHEFRTPLSLIISPIEKMLKNPDKQSDNSQLKLIYRNARRLLNLVNQLLDFRRMEVQKINLKPTYGDLVQFIEEIYKTFKDLAERKSIQFTFQANFQEFFTYFDHDKVEKIVFNLLSNAFKFTPEDKSITITLSIDPGNESEKKDGSFTLDIKDTGMGMSGITRQKVFDRFFQSDTHGGFGQGSGIGLSLTKDFVELHKGTINVDSEEGKGSTFTVILPLLDKAPEIIEESTPVSEEMKEISISAQAEDDSQDIPQRTEKATILIVEDNDDFRFYLKDNLKEEYSILEAPNGKLGLEMANKNLPDLIVSDVMMPEMDGIELCQQIKSNASTSHIPVILLTARMAESKKVEGFETGADDYITKPFSFELLESRMNNLIRQRERIKQGFQKNFKIEPGDIAITSLDEKLINKALQLVEEQMGNPDFSVEKLSRELGMSRVHLYKKLTALTGKTPIEFIRIMRLKRAAQLLEKSQLTIAEIAYEVGFNDPRYFSRYFKAEFGMLPSQYIQSKKEG